MLGTLIYGPVLHAGELPRVNPERRMEGFQVEVRAVNLPVANASWRALPHQSSLETGASRQLPFIQHEIYPTSELPNVRWVTWPVL